MGLGVNCLKQKGLGKLKNFQLKLPTDLGVTPVRQPLRRIPIAIRDRVEKELNSLLEMDIIEKVNGPSLWESPIVPVPKGGKGIRLYEIVSCLD